SEVGLVLFMPALIAIDAFHERWMAGGTGWRYRLSAAVAIALTAGVGIISPLAFLAPLFVIPAYALASGARWPRWLLVATPALGGTALLVQLFWIGPFVDFHAFINSHSPPMVYNPEQAVLLPLQKLFALSPLGPHNDHDERLSLAPVAALAALMGVVFAVRDRRARVATAVA